MSEIILIYHLQQTDFYVQKKILLPSKLEKDFESA